MSLDDEVKNPYVLTQTSKNGNLITETYEYQLLKNEISIRINQHTSENIKGEKKQETLIRVTGTYTNKKPNTKELDELNEKNKNKLEMIINTRNKPPEGDYILTSKNELIKKTFIQTRIIDEDYTNNGD